MLVVLALSTGARYGELINLKWENLTFDDKIKEVRLCFMHTKNGEIRTVTVNALAYELLKENSDDSLGVTYLTKKHMIPFPILYNKKRNTR